MKTEKTMKVENVKENGVMKVTMGPFKGIEQEDIYGRRLDKFIAILVEEASNRRTMTYLSLNAAKEMGEAFLKATSKQKVA